MVNRLKHRVLKLRESEKAFKVGLVLLIINVPLGWMFLALGSVLTVKFKSKAVLYLFSSLYASTWVMLGLGVLLAGPKGYRIAKKKLSMFKFWKRHSRC